MQQCLLNNYFVLHAFLFFAFIHGSLLFYWPDHPLLKPKEKGLHCLADLGHSTTKLRKYWKANKTFTKNNSHACAAWPFAAIRDVNQLFIYECPTNITHGNNYSFAAVHRR
jgi:hypothetical protein